MPQFQYKDGYLFCTQCKKNFKEEICPYHQSKVQRYQICPECPQKYKLRRHAHNKNSTKYYLAVMKPKLEKDREVIIKWKQNRTTDNKK